jgi:hypothetical protein
MLKPLQATVEDLSGPHPFLVFLEVVVVTLLLPGLGLWTHPQDPFFLHASFPWLVLAPLILSLRYGFASGLGSAAALSLLMYVLFRLGRPEIASFPGSLALGLLFIAMLAGEFCDMWHRRLHRLNELNNHHHLLVQKFTRSYQLLALSHERLEKRVLANTRSLRETMTYLRERVLAVETDSGEGDEIFHLIMEVLGSFGMLQVAALYRIDEYGIFVPKMVAKLGNPKPVPIDDPMLLEACKTRQLTCVKPEEPQSLASEQPAAPRSSETLLAMLPLLDVHGGLRGVVAVQAMPFEALSRDHLNLLSVLSGHLGDLLALAWGSGAAQFHTCLLRSHSDARTHNVAAMLLGVLIDPELAPPTLFNALLEQHRDLDHQWLTRNRRGQRVLLMVMPLTDSEGAAGFVHRLEAWSRLRYSKPLAEVGVRIHQLELNGVGRAKDRLQVMKDTCELHDA